MAGERLLMRDLKNQRFGNLVVIKSLSQRSRFGNVRWLCKCDCGKEHISLSHNLINGNTKSCGCSSSKFRRGNKHKLWKGGRCNERAYILLYMPEHPNARKNGYIFEHIFIMSQSLGRPLYPNEIVHHKNGIKNDNRLENLDLRLISQHLQGQSVEGDLIPYSIAILKRYKPEVLK
jgi:hypothetical protein